MRKLYALLLLCLLPAVALAETILEVPNAGYITSFLVDEGTIHVLFTYRHIENYYVNDGRDIFNIHEDRAECYELTENHQLVPCQKQCVRIFGEPEVVETELSRDVNFNLEYYPNHLISLQRHTYLREIENQTLRVSRWQPGKDYEVVATVSLEQFGGNPVEPEQTFAVAISNTTLYFVIDKSEGMVTKNALYAYDIPSGEIQEIYTSNYAIRSIIFASDTDVLLHTQKGYELINLSTGEVEKSRKGFSDLVVDIIPDGNGGFYMLGHTGLYKLDGDLQEECIYQLPAGQTARSELVYRADTHDFVFLVGNKEGNCFLYIIDEERPEPDSVNLVDIANELGNRSEYIPDMEEFYTAHDHFQVVKVENITDYDQLNQQLVLGSDAFDVMMLDACSISLSNLYQKGYYYDLSDQADIKGYLASAYPAYREACMAGDQIAALPLVARESIMMINQPLWEELGLPIPTTYGELLQTIDQCLDEGILDEHPLFQSDRLELDSQGKVISFDRFAPTESYNTLWYQLLQSYIAASQRQGQLTFQDNTIITLMDTLHDMKDKLDEHDARRVVGEALLYPSGTLTDLTLGKVYSHDAFRPLLLGVHDAEDIAVPVRLKVLLINPRSPKADLAKAYVAYFAAHPTSTTRCVITMEQPDGIQKNNAGISRETEEENEANYEARIEAAKAEGDLLTARDLEEELARFKENKVFNWDVTPEAAQAYYQVTPYLVVMDSENLGFVEENGSRDIATFAEGRIDAKTLCQRLEQLLMMRRMENQ